MNINYVLRTVPEPCRVENCTLHGAYVNMVVIPFHLLICTIIQFYDGFAAVKERNHSFKSLLNGAVLLPEQI